jgi:3-dehydroquinate synthase
MQQTIKFPSGKVEYFFQSSFEELWEKYDRRNVVIITDDRVMGLYAEVFFGLKIVVLPTGEHSKDIDTIDRAAKELLRLEANRKAMLIGVGGGVVTDITGFLATVYMRGVAFGFVPTTLLAMADAAIGGKNGVNLGLNKNILGTFAHPEFVLYDSRFAATLPDSEWSNGFAEIIKYACIFDAAMFEELSKNNIGFYRNNASALWTLVERCVDWKNKTVLADEKETGVRKLLNFGHTAGHAIENLYELAHGEAVGIGMLIACTISEEVSGLNKNVTSELEKLLIQYHLPVHLNIDVEKTMELLRMDKKRSDDTIDYILLEQTGKAVIRPLPLTIIEKALHTYESYNRTR